MAGATDGLDFMVIGHTLVFIAALKDATGAVLATGTTTLMLVEVQENGTYLTYDWDDDTFKAGACTTPTTAMTHQAADNDTVNTGTWTKALATLTGFTEGVAYIYFVDNTLASVRMQPRKFVYGGLATEIHAAKAALVNAREHTVATGVDVIMDDDGETPFVTMTPTEAEGVVTVTPS